jgi:hypothetical protein
MEEARQGWSIVAIVLLADTMLTEIVRATLVANDDTIRLFS